MSSHTTHAATATTAVDLTKAKPYGDTMNDGMMELTFTLPVPYGEEANEAAKQLAKKMGLDEPAVVSLMQSYARFIEDIQHADKA